MASPQAIETDALIIGAGPVGLFQAFQLGLLEISCHIVDALPHAGGQCAALYGDKPIYDIPGTVATTGHGLAEALLRQIAPFNVPMHLGEQVMALQREADGRLRLSTTRGTVFLAKTVFIAAGVGAFVPRRIGIDGLERFEGSQVFYHPDTLDRFTGQTVVVNGGDDSALATALALVGHPPPSMASSCMSRSPTAARSRCPPRPWWLAWVCRPAWARLPTGAWRWSANRSPWTRPDLKPGSPAFLRSATSTPTPAREN